MNDLKSLSYHFGFNRCRHISSTKKRINNQVSKLNDLLVLRNNGSSELHKLRLILEKFMSVECTKVCQFYSWLCFRNDQVYIYITGLRLFCSNHANLFTEAAEIAVPSEPANLC